MNASGIGVLLILVSIVGLLIFLVNKSQILEDKDPPAPDREREKDDWEGTSARKPKPICDPEPNSLSKQSYECVYAYVPNGKVRRCGHCDGENPMTAVDCCICGNKMDA